MIYEPNFGVEKIISDGVEKIISDDHLIIELFPKKRVHRGRRACPNFSRAYLANLLYL